MPSAALNSPRAAATSAALLEAAIEEFASFGFRRASMEGVARRAGVSRATLYTHWGSKEELFRALVSQLHEEHLSAMSEALNAARNGEGSFRDRLYTALHARFARFVELTSGSPHAAELYDLHGRICGEIARDSQARAESLLACLLRDAVRHGEVDLSRSGLTPARAAARLFECAHVAKGEDPSTATPESFARALREVVALVAAGIESAR